MTAEELVARLVSSRKGITPERLERAKARATQFGIAWSVVEALLLKRHTGDATGEP